MTLGKVVGIAVAGLLVIMVLAFLSQTFID